MVTREWCLRHDREVLAAIVAIGDTGEVPVANAGKHWRHGAPAKRAGLCGWWVPDVGLYDSRRRGHGFVERGLGDDWPHDREWADYGTTTLLVWEKRPE
jgi:hypothetical protein